jgi:hypothetical protein
LKDGGVDSGAVSKPAGVCDGGIALCTHGPVFWPPLASACGAT